MILRRDHFCHESRTNAVLPWEACQMAALRRSGVRVRSIAQAMGRSRSGVQGVLARLGLAGRPWPRTRRPVVLTGSAEAAVGLLCHPQARRLTWRQQAVLWGRVRGDPPWSIAADLGIRPDSIRWHVQAARERLARLGMGRCRRVLRRRPGADLATLLAALEADLPESSAVRRSRKG
jgi:hypothetical protein